MARLADYEGRYRHAVFTREAGVLEVRVHTDGGPLVWSPSADRELADAFGDVASDPETKVVVLTGTGDAFIDVMDGQAFVSEGVGWDAIWWEGKRLLTNLIDIDVPVIGVVNGPATVHAELAVLSDIVIASDTVGVSRRTAFPRGHCSGRRGAPGMGASPRNDPWTLFPADWSADQRGRSPGPRRGQ